MIDAPAIQKLILCVLLLTGIAVVVADLVETWTGHLAHRAWRRRVR